MTVSLFFLSPCGDRVRRRELIYSGFFTGGLRSIFGKKLSPLISFSSLVLVFYRYAQVCQEIALHLHILLGEIVEITRYQMLLFVSYLFVVT